MKKIERKIRRFGKKKRVPLKDLLVDIEIETLEARNSAERSKTY